MKCSVYLLASLLDLLLQVLLLRVTQSRRNKREDWIAPTYADEGLDLDCCNCSNAHNRQGTSYQRDSANFPMEVSVPCHKSQG